MHAARRPAQFPVDVSLSPGPCVARSSSRRRGRDRASSAFLTASTAPRPEDVGGAFHPSLFLPLADRRCVALPWDPRRGQTLAAQPTSWCARGLRRQQLQVVPSLLSSDLRLRPHLLFVAPSIQASGPPSVLCPAPSSCPLHPASSNEGIVSMLSLYVCARQTFLTY